MSAKFSRITTSCPECGGNIYFKSSPRFGQPVVCPDCHTTLEVVESSPVTLEWADDSSANRKDNKRTKTAWKKQRRQMRVDLDL